MTLYAGKGALEMNHTILRWLVLIVFIVQLGAVGLVGAESSGNKAKETGKEIWETLKKDVKEVKTTVKEQGRRARKAAKRNLKEAKETFTPDKSKSDSPK
jgi:hypothetical protein